MIRLLLAGFVAFAAWTGAAHAHTRSQSMSHWRVDAGAVSGRVEADAVDVTRLYALGVDTSLQETFERHAATAFSFSTDGGDCRRIGAPAPAPASAGRIAVRLRFECPDNGAAQQVTIGSTLFLDVAATHLHFASVTAPDGAGSEAVLTDTRRSAALDLKAQGPAAGAWETFIRYVPVGAVHVWGGLDHLAFILGLTLLARGLGSVALAATGFTLGHTATLALAALGVLSPDSATVEALIGFTVAFVAVEAARDGPARLTRWSVPIAAGLLVMAALSIMNVVAIAAVSLAGLAVFAWAYPRGFPRGAAAAPGLAAAFGLIHGCGFAGALGDLDLPRPRLLAGLAGFNVGVEAAQVVVIVAALAVGWAWKRSAGVRFNAAPDVAAAGLLALGTYWFASRAFGA
ncbi:MAG: HupE/UreJ family protein [Hyphomonadaceae bacterium]|nr:HupE/UreJ family protein [Hyphomonadaceae bacterium]